MNQRDVNLIKYFCSFDHLNASLTAVDSHKILKLSFSHWQKFVMWELITRFYTFI